MCYLYFTYTPVFTVSFVLGSEEKKQERKREQKREFSFYHLPQCHPQPSNNFRQIPKYSLVPNSSLIDIVEA